MLARVDRMPIDTSVWSLYVVRCADESLYTGITTDVSRRLREHQRGTRGARYLRGRAPLTLEFSVVVGDRGAASRAENSVKRLSKSEKERLLRSPENLRRKVLDYAIG